MEKLLSLLDKLLDFALDQLYEKDSYLFKTNHCISFLSLSAKLN